MSKKILFITTHNLATNPRLVKEIELALQHEYKVEVIGYIFRNWSYEVNNELQQQFKKRGVQFHCIEAGRENKLEWFISVFKEKGYRLFSKLLSLQTCALANSISRRNTGILKALKKITSADWVIGHNPGALWATLSAGKKLNCKTGFDIEDYHPGEGDNFHLQKLTKKLMQQVLPNMDYVSFAAPLIMNEVKKDIGFDNCNWFTVLNYFPAQEFYSSHPELSGPAKLVWFSQHINSGRGLELILPPVKQLAGKVELHLYGNVNLDFKKEYLDNIENVFLHGTLSQKELHGKLCRYDIGLALEPAKDKNNELAISNKLLAYLQAGLYVMATGTKSQYTFLKDFPGMGICFDYKENDSEKVLLQILETIDSIRSSRQERLRNFKNNNWENESKKLLKVWESS